MAAISTTLMSLLSPGDHVVFQEAIYGGTQSLILKEFQRLGIDYSFVPCTAESLVDAVQANTRVVYAETPANPLMQIVDLQRLSDLLTSKDVITVVDNTFASPINQNPIELGIQMVLHSGTKYLGGHSDLTFGAVVGRSDLVDRVYEKAVLYGGNLNSLSIYLIQRSIKTLEVRVSRQNENALQLAEFLQRHALIEKVFYPGLASHPGHEIARSQMRGFGGMMSFELSHRVQPREFLEHLELIAPAVSLGGIESTATLPAYTSHKPVPKDVRERAGITDRMVRLSVGIESADDLVRDLDQALTMFAPCNSGAQLQTNT